MLFKFLFLFLVQSKASEFVVWNVGQGQWTTEILRQACLHFDMGGEINPIRQVLKACSGKKNYLFLSHWDWDHISYAASFSNQSQNTCLVQLPVGATSSRKEKLISQILLCSGNDLLPISHSYKKIFSPSTQRTSRQTPNELSTVYESPSSQVIIPGDSPLSQEYLWLDDLPLIMRGLVLGHHGSKTSTSERLFRHTHFRWAVASARAKKYGHPHKRVIELLRRYRVPLLLTEDWGNIHFEVIDSH